MNGKRPDRREIKINQMGGRIIDTDILDEEIHEIFLGDLEEESDIFITRTSKGQLDCAHRWMEPYIICECCQQRVYCKICFYQGSVKQCSNGHYVGPCCHRRGSWLSSDTACGICNSPLLLPPSKETPDRMPERQGFPISVWIIIPGVFLPLLLILPGWLIFCGLFFLSLYVPEFTRFMIERVKKRLDEPKTK
jgi:hypothetical protein